MTIESPELQEQQTEYSLTASHLLEYLFCPRFTYFEYVLDIPQHEEKRFKVDIGRTIHEKIRKTNPEYLRKKLGVKAAIPAHDVPKLFFSIYVKTSDFFTRSEEHTSELQSH